MSLKMKKYFNFSKTDDSVTKTPNNKVEVDHFVKK